MEPEPAFIKSDGTLGDVELHAPLLDGNSRADHRFAAGAIRRAIAGGTPLDAALQIYGVKQAEKPE